MPAYFDTGFSVRQPMWHGLGEVLSEAPATIDDARRAAGLLWEPEEAPVYRRLVVKAGDVAPEGAQAISPWVLPALGQPVGRDTPVMAPLTEHKLVARNDSGRELAVHRSDFPIITHDQMFDLLETIATEAGSGFKFETAGSIQGGRKVWALAYLDEPFTIPGDDSATLPFFALQNAHDGEGACRVIPTSVRIVCWNTWRAASDEADRNGFEVVIRHAGNVGERIEAAKASLANARRSALAYAESMTQLTELNYSDAVLTTFLEGLFPVPEGAADRTVEDRAQKRTLCRRMLSESPTLAPLPNTAYKLVQMAGEYQDHLRMLPKEGRKDIYLKRTLFNNDGAKVKAHTITFARELCSSAG